MSLKSVALLAAMLVAPSIPAFADNYSASTNPSPLASACTGTLGGNRVAAPTSASVSCTGNGFDNLGTAAATPGQVHAMAFAGGVNGTQATATFDGSVTFNSATGGETRVQFLIPLDGTMTRVLGSATADENPNSISAVTQVDASWALDGANQEGFERSIFQNSAGVHDQSAVPSVFDIIGDWHSDNLNIVLVTAPLLVQTNQLHRFTFNLVVSAASSGQNESATADFSQTFGFKPGFAPFILQDGVTANAGDYIVNNVVVDPNAAAGGAPEPGQWALLVLGFAAIGGAARRRRTGLA